MLYSIIYTVIALLFTIKAENNHRNVHDEFNLKLDPSHSNNTMNSSTLIRSSIFDQLTNLTLGTLGDLQPGSSSDKETIGNVVFNVHHFTQFLFDGNHVYIYSPKKNEENINYPRKWTFFYVPILQPVQTAIILPWVTINKLEIRVRLALGTPKVEEAARQAIANQFSPEIAEKYSKSWVVAPLMLDSLSAYVVTVGSTPVLGVVPFHVDNPNSNVITLRFVCPIKEIALIVAAGLLIGDFDIEISLYFSGMHRVRTNMVTITATQLQSVLSKTIADGGGTNSTYIHRDQATSFVAKYVTNVKKLIYIEDPTTDMSILTRGLEEQLTAVFQESINKAKEIQIKAGAFDQVWHSADLNPDRITSEMFKMFKFNTNETERHNNSENYYSINQRKDILLPAHTPLDMRIRTACIGVDFIVPSNSQQNKNSEEYETTTLDAVSESDITKAASQIGIEGGWMGHKFIPKSFKVYKLIDLVDKLQVAVIAKQLLAEKRSGALIRRVGASSSLLNNFNFFSSLNNETLFASLENTSILALEAGMNISQSIDDDDDEGTATSTTNNNFLTGEIKLYAGSSPPSPPWLLCDGSIVSRLEYPRLFSVIGTQYGEGDDSTTFKLPDLRGRVPLGVDPEQLRVNVATQVGNQGGNANHTLTVDQLPSHLHNVGTLRNSYDGYHNHNIHDPGHNHGGMTSPYAIVSSNSTDKGEYNFQLKGPRIWQSYTIPPAYTQISLLANGNHTHELIGETDSTGQNEVFSILPPFQSFYYIIYAD